MKSFCYFPNIHLQIKPSGVIKPCCRFDVEEAKKIQSTAESLDLLKSPHWEILRNQLSLGKPPLGCRKCVEEESLGVPSMRLKYDQMLSSYDFNDLDPEAIQLLDLEIGFGNLCNLKCRTCNSSLSSSWYDDDTLLSQSLPFHRHKPRRKIINANLDMHTRDSLKSVQSIKFTGGEPMLHTDFGKFLSLLIEAGRAAHTKLRLCTNASYIPKEATMSLLRRFKHVDISVSIDGYSQFNEYLRHPSNWQETLESLNFWKNQALAYDWTLTLCSTISAYTIEAITVLDSWWINWRPKEISKKFHILHQPAFSPMYTSPSIVPAIVVSKLLGGTNHKTTAYFNAKNATKNNVRNFLEFNAQLDNLRSESFEEVFPNLASHLNDWLAQADVNDAT